MYYYRVYSVISDLLQSLRERVGCLYKLSECVAMLDLVVALTQVCSVLEYGMSDLKLFIQHYLIVRPEFNDTLAIKQGRHPILEKLSQESLVPNSAVREREEEGGGEKKKNIMLIVL